MFSQGKNKMDIRSLTFEEKIQLVKKSSMGVPKTINIDLSVAIPDQPYDIAGNVFYVFSAPGESEYVGIKVNETREPVINYSVHCGLQTPFYRLYITTPAGQTGTVQIIYGTEAPDLMEILDHRSTTIAGVGGILDELRGDVTPENLGAEITVGNAAAVEIIAANASRKACMVQAKSTNAGIVYIGFDNTVATNLWVAELLAGMSFSVDDYRGDLYARASAAGQLVGWGEW